MQLPFTHHPLELSVLIVSLLIWRGIEAGVEIRTFKRLRTAREHHDKGSYLVLICLLVFGLLLGLLIAVKVPGTALSSANSLFFWLGILLIYAGMVLRISAIIVLGTFFTTRVAVTFEQTVIEAGPYRLIRHPAYTGFLINWLGFGLCLTNNWLSLLVIMGSALLGIGYRIYIEEHVLQEHLGLPYQEYMRRTKRLIPFVL